MSALYTFDLPDPGEGLTEAEIVEWKVKVGDQIEVNQVLVEIETAKSLVELPSPVAGTVQKILVEEGEEPEVGSPILVIDTAGGPLEPDSGDTPAAEDADARTEAPVPADPDESATAAASAPSSTPVAPVPSSASATPPPAAPAHAAPAATPAGAAASSASTEPSAPTGSAADDDVEPPNLVGYGVKPGSRTRRPRRTTGPTAPRQSDDQIPIERILAKPPVRKLAKDLGIALADVLASGPGGVVTRNDVLAAADQRGHSTPSSIAPSPAGTSDPEADFFPDEAPQVPEGLDGTMRSARDTRFGEDLSAYPGVETDERTTRVPIRSVRKRTAEAMVSSAFTAPHVTVFNEIDMTASMNLVARLKADKEWRDVHVSPLLIVAKALLVAIRRHPEVNASWDEPNKRIIYKHYVNLGIAAATPRGLIVPNVKDAHLLTLRELADAIGELTMTARAGKTPLKDTTDGTITITNFGVFGIDSGTPILNPGESVILGLGAIKKKAWVGEDGQITVRPVTQLAISFDHRLIDGALGSELMRDVSAVLENPQLGLVWG